jgi:hypothetical protein
MTKIRRSDNKVMVRQETENQAKSYNGNSPRKKLREI